MSELRFSIFLPTFNRASILYRQLSVLLSFLQGNPDIAEQTEVIVSDNCSTDDTLLICEHFSAQFASILNFKIHQNQTNIGAVKNFFLAPYKCAGEFLWILGDDDILLPSNLASIFSQIWREKPDFTICATSQEAIAETKIINIIDLFEQFPITSLAHISRIFYRRSIWLSPALKLKEVPNYYIWPLLLPVINVPAEAKMFQIAEPIVFSTKDGGLEIWRGKTPLARLAEFDVYIKSVVYKGANLDKLYRLNFKNGSFVAKKYLGACLFMTEEKQALNSCRELLAYYGLRFNLLVAAGNLLRQPALRSLVIILRRIAGVK